MYHHKAHINGYRAFLAAQKTCTICARTLKNRCSAVTVTAVTAAAAVTVAVAVVIVAVVTVAAVTAAALLGWYYEPSALCFCRFAFSIS
jgi:hypothetical protein